MGVPALFSLIAKKYGSVIRGLESRKGVYHNFYLDCNSIIYDCARKPDLTVTDESLIKAVCQQIEAYIRKVSPTETAFITFDGVAPVAKLENQRNRRYKSEFTRRVLERSGEATNGWDTTAITPGTAFMNKLDKGLTDYFSGKGIAKRLGVKNIMLSGSKEHGEGEHKIYQYIRNNPKKHNDEVTVIYGLDADLIMLSINHLYICPRIFLFRETPHFIRSLNKNLDPGQLYTLDINELFEKLSVELGSAKSADSTGAKEIAFDYIFMTSILGNDYIPHNPAFNLRTKGMAYVMDGYKQSIASKGLRIVEKDRIIWKNFRKFAQELAAKEESCLIAEHTNREMLERKPLIIRGDGEPEIVQRLNAVPVYNREKEKYIDPTRPMWQERYYRTLFGVSRSEAHIICQAYLEALEWTQRYYTSGCVDWRWAYPYHYAPLFEDIVRQVPMFDVRQLDEKPEMPVHPLCQLSYVLPLSAHHMLPAKLKEVLYDKMGSRYSDNWEFEWSYCRYFWECHAKMKRIDVDYLQQKVESLMMKK